MTWQTELASWTFPTELKSTEPPATGEKAPLTFPTRAAEGTPTIITFLRHCGCPFAEKTFLAFREVAKQNPNVYFVAVSHSDKPSTDHWLASLPDASQNQQSNLQVIVDDEREVYAAWGLGTSSLWHILNPGGLYAAYQLGKQENIWNRPTESGSRWQTSGSFALDGEAMVKWSKPSKRMDDMPDFEEALAAVAVDE